MSRALTPKRLFGGSPPVPSPPRELRLSPDGRFASFLSIASDDRERLDLWGLALQSGELGCWLAATDLPSAGANGAEQDQQERKRLFGHGITGHAWNANSDRLLVKAGGAGYLFTVADRSIGRATPGAHGYTDIQLSPRGRFVSYVRDRSLFYWHPDSTIERVVARSQDETISFGTADFLAQEEMHRFEGHWWHPDEAAIVFTRVDEAAVASIRRFGTENLATVAQRYPFTGTENPRVTLGWYSLNSGATDWLDYADEPGDYLARVQFAHGKLVLAVQNRAQNRLRVKVVGPSASAPRLLFEEQSETWINLNPSFTAIGKADYLFISERSGTGQLFRHRAGALEQVTRGTGHIEKILHANRHRALVSGWLKVPTERHLIRVDLATGKPRQATASGWHEPLVSENGKALLDWYSDLGNPGELRFGPARAEPRVLAWPSSPSGCADGQRQIPATPTLGSLEAEDGQKLHFRLTRPTPGGQQKPPSGFPLIVWVYGGPGAQIVRNAWPPVTLQLFAQNGFAVLELDNRGSANRGPAFEAPLFRRLGDAEVRDQVLGARYAAGLDWVDGQRIGVFGHSYGGYMSLMCLAKAPELFRAGVSVAPVTDWRLYDTHYTERFLGHPDANPEGYETSSVFAWLDGMQGKLLVMHGLADDNVLFAHTAKLIRALQRRHYPFELMAYPGAKHALQERDVSIHRFNLILDFFRRNL